MRKIVSLDAVRGGAAFVVVAGHFFDGLDPAVSRRLAGTPLAGLLNGTAAVVLFFVLSGFVLTIRPLAGGSIRALGMLLVKRWPRLAGTVVAGSLFYIVVARLGGFPSLQTLAHYTVAGPPYVYWGQTLNDGDAGPVLAEAAAGTFLRNAAQHNAVLWTMHWELLGSVLSACLAAILLQPWPRIIVGALFLGTSALASTYSLWLLPFPLGVAGAALHLRLGARIRIPALAALVLFGACLLTWSWDIRAAGGIWSWSNRLTPPLRLPLWLVAQSIAACCCMVAALYCPSVARVLSGRAGAFAGRLSFPVYLMHLLVMLTFSSWAIILLAPRIPNGHQPIMSVLFAATLAVTVAVSIPIAIFDRWWVKSLDQLTRRVFSMMRRPQRVAATTVGPD